jgi:hypothetical protein
MPMRPALVVSSPPATEEIGAMGREIESCPGVCMLGGSFLIKSVGSIHF